MTQAWLACERSDEWAIRGVFMDVLGSPTTADFPRELCHALGIAGSRLEPSAAWSSQGPRRSARAVQHGGHGDEAQGRGCVPAQHGALVAWQLQPALPRAQLVQTNTQPLQRNGSSADPYRSEVTPLLTGSAQVRRRLAGEHVDPRRRDQRARHRAAVPGQHRGGRHRHDRGARPHVYFPAVEAALNRRTRTAGR